MKMMFGFVWLFPFHLVFPFTSTHKVFLFVSFLVCPVLLHQLAKRFHSENQDRNN